MESDAIALNTHEFSAAQLEAMQQHQLVQLVQQLQAQRSSTTITSIPNNKRKRDDLDTGTKEENNSGRVTVHKKYCFSWWSCRLGHSLFSNLVSLFFFSCNTLPIENHIFLLEETKKRNRKGDGLDEMVTSTCRAKSRLFWMAISRSGAAESFG
jgi:hypothetical protein